MVAMTLGAVAAALGAEPDAHAIVSGEALYIRNCRPCHAPGFTGYFMLSRRVGKGQEDLAARHLIDPALVQVVVRNGINGMPRIPRGTVSDTELALIIRYLNRPRPVAAPTGASQ
jgi:mono/diheme cytochrome c family protein